MSICPQATSANLSGFRSKLKFTDSTLEINHVRNQIPHDHLKSFLCLEQSDECVINADMAGMYHFFTKTLTLQLASEIIKLLRNKGVKSQL